MGEHVNEVRLIGRLGSTVEERDLPSGTRLTSFSLIIDRAGREIHGRTKVDTIACHTTRSSVASRVVRAKPAECLEVVGALRRRFWRGGSGLGSATEVEVTRIRAVNEGPVHGVG